MAKKTMEERLDAILGLESDINDAAQDANEPGDDDLSTGREMVPVEYDNVPSIVTEESDAADDYRFSRKIMYGLINRGTSALEEALRIAGESEHPRAIEVANGLMKNISEITKDLLALQKIDINGSKGNVQTAQTITNNQTNIYVGNTADIPEAMAELDRLIEEDGEDESYLEELESEHSPANSKKG